MDQHSHNDWYTFQHPVTKRQYRYKIDHKKPYWTMHWTITVEGRILNNSQGIPAESPRWAYRLAYKSIHRIMICHSPISQLFQVRPQGTTTSVHNNQLLPILTEHDSQGFMDHTAAIAIAIQIRSGLRLGGQMDL